MCCDNKEVVIMKSPSCFAHSNGYNHNKAEGKTKWSGPVLFHVHHCSLLLLHTRHTIDTGDITRQLIPIMIRTQNVCVLIVSTK